MMPQIKERESGLVKFQAQEDINKKNREERLRRRNLALEKVNRILDDKETLRKNG